MIWICFCRYRLSRHLVLMVPTAPFRLGVGVGPLLLVLAVEVGVWHVLLVLALVLLFALVVVLPAAASSVAGGGGCGTLQT